MFKTIRTYISSHYYYLTLFSIMFFVRIFNIEIRVAISNIRFYFVESLVIGLIFLFIFQSSCVHCYEYI